MALLLLMTIVSISFSRLLELLQNAEFFEIVDGQHNSSIEAFLACCSFIKHTEHQKHKCGDYQLFSTAMSNASEICMNVRRARCRQVGAYLHWLYDHKYTDLDYSLQLPNFKRTAPQIPQVWSPEEIDKILAVIDTANPVGRRNYAIFLLLARTGLRISDVLGLKFSNINWKENCISLSQQKTGNALSLPLSKELGMAIISYLQDGRPQSSSAFIFLSHNAPFQPLGEHNNFNPEFHKYLRRAGIAIPTKRHTGVHTIRHSFATNMLRKGTPVQDVSQILGHSNISVTETYLRVDIEHMRLCSLSLEGLL